MAGSARFTASGIKLASGAANNIVGHWDWSTLTGTTSNALLDTGKTIPLDRNGSSGAGLPALNVVSGTGLPNSRPAPPDGIANVLQVKRNLNDNAPFLQCGTTDGTNLDVPHWSDLAVGEVIRFRVYTMMDIPNAEGDKYLTASNHPFQCPWAFSSTPLAWYSYSSMADGTFTFAMRTSDHTIPADNNIFILGTFNGTTQYGDQLPKFVWYRVEWGMRRDTSSGYSMYLRWYSAAGTLLYSEDGVGASLGSVKNATGSQVTIASLNGVFVSPGVDGIRSFSIGHNGGQHDYSVDVYYYWAALAVAKGAEASTPLIGIYTGGI